MEFLPPKVAHKEISMARMMTRPTMHDLVKEAMAGTLSKVDITAEAARQLGHPVTPQEKTAAQEGPTVLPDEVIEKYASALEHLAKEAADPGSAGEASPGVGPGQGAGQVMQVLEAKSEGDGVMEAGQSGQAISQDVPPKDPPLMKTDEQNADPGNAMQTNDDMEHPEQPEDPMGNEKAPIAAQKQAQVNLGYLLQLAGMAPGEEQKTAALAKKNFEALAKLAEDAINPAQISAGAETAQGADAPDGASASEDGPIPPEPSDVNSQKRMIASNDAAINYTKREAKSDPKKDLGKVINEPALSAAHDSVLQKAWDNTDRAGAKIASAKLTKTAAAHALLLKLAEEAEEEKKDQEKKKEKNSQINPALSTPQGQTGMSASNMGGGTTGM
jgi:hypothetical protein